MTKEDKVKITRKYMRIVIGLIGVALGAGIGAGLTKVWLIFFKGNELIAPIVCYSVCCVATGIIAFILAPKIIHVFSQVPKRLIAWTSDVPTNEMLSGAIGLVGGLLVAFLISSLIQQFPLVPWILALISTALYAFLGLTGWTIGRTRFGEAKLVEGIFSKRKDAKGKVSTNVLGHARPKVLDTSVIIDGRIFDICQTGVIEGELVIPGFVLQELRHVSDSADSLKRARGRRGLDILHKIQSELDVPVRVDETDYDDIAEVDAKLVRRAQDLGGVVVTNDYNLNKVATVQRVPVLNINELANAVKPVVLPGEEMTVTIMKEGKEQGQGIAYLDDGTMIVVENTQKAQGETLDVVVTSVLQTAAGRMIFAKRK